MLDDLRRELAMPPEQREQHARRLVQQLVLAAQGSLMLRHAPQPIADAFIGSRGNAVNGRVYGTLSAAALRQDILQRAWPE